MKAELKDKLVEIFETVDIDDSTVMRDLETWDSLAGLSIVALCDAKYGFTLKAADLKPLVTIGDLAAYIESHKTK